ncbi:hypothetical protein [Micromonospora sp. NPDC005324]|uniref:hypothetical protein n=1 Tax=Micromonospora sp. NPDC005324 TaxID=3157033 RepID=UPI0033BABC46
MPVPTYRLGRLLVVGEPLSDAAPDAGLVVVHFRVSSAEQRTDLARQAARANRICRSVEATKTDPT